MKILFIVLSLLSQLLADDVKGIANNYKLTTTNKAAFAKANIANLHQIETYSDFFKPCPEYKILSFDFLYAVKGGSINPRHINGLDMSLLPEDKVKLLNSPAGTMIVLDNILARRKDGVTLILGSLIYSVTE